MNVSESTHRVSNDKLGSNDVFRWANNDRRFSGGQLGQAAQGAGVARRAVLVADLSRSTRASLYLDHMGVAKGLKESFFLFHMSHMLSKALHSRIHA